MANQRGPLRGGVNGGSPHSCYAHALKSRPLVAGSRGGPEVTGEGIRAIPVRSIVSAGASDVSPKTFQGPIKADTFKRVNDDALRLVTDVYRSAILAGNPPTQAVAHHLFFEVRSTAARWVMRARERGFLGPAEPGRAGERPRKRRKGKT
jgi:hypothetical protein